MDRPAGERVARVPDRWAVRLAGTWPRRAANPGLVEGQPVDAPGRPLAPGDEHRRRWPQRAPARRATGARTMADGGAVAVRGGAPAGRQPDRAGCPGADGAVPGSASL